jgi:hypothetical protein
MAISFVISNNISWLFSNIGNKWTSKHIALNDGINKIGIDKMKNLKIVVVATLLLAVLAGIGFALTPPPPPPPPVPQHLGLYDTTIDLLQTNATDQSACRQCHQSTGTNVSGGYNNTIGGVDTRHHNMVATSVINPYTNVPFGCQDCHPSTPGIGNGILLDHACTDCHNGTSFWADSSLGAHVGNFSRPHHVNTANDTAHIGTPAANRTCNFCHGSFVANYNDGHYVPSYDTSFMITPYATYKITNFSQPDGLGAFKVWGGCESCHLNNDSATPYPIGDNHFNHHKEILGFGIDPDGTYLGGTTPYQNASTPFNVKNKCTVCHVIDINNVSGIPPFQGNTFILELNITNSLDGENLFPAVEVRNSTIEQQDAAIGAFEPGTTNITINGTGCEKCHSVASIHNIQYNYSQNGQQGLGHINNNTDCYGCHNSWLPADTWMPGPLIPAVDSINPTVIVAGVPTTVTLTGSNFVNPDGNYTSVLAVDGTQYTPTTLTQTQMVVNVPALTAGTHQLQIVKAGSTLSKLATLTVVQSTTISSATMVSSKTGITLTLNGAGFGATKPTSSLSVSVSHAGNQIASTTITKWGDTQVVAKFPTGSIKSTDIATVVTQSSGEAQKAIS